MSTELRLMFLGAAGTVTGSNAETPGELSSTGEEEVVTTDTIRHETNAIGVGRALADSVAEPIG